MAFSNPQLGAYYVPGIIPGARFGTGMKSCVTFIQEAYVLEGTRHGKHGKK